MSKSVTSARGERIDFDLLRIKSTMAALPTTESVEKRERFINKKRRRGMKRRVDEIAQTKHLENANFESATEAANVVDVADDADVNVDESESHKRRKVK
jgi:hypothetical protein